MSVLSEREVTSLLISLSTCFEDADKILRERTNCKTDKECIEYLQDLFDVQIVFREGEDDIHTDYVAMLSSIIGHV